MISTPATSEPKFRAFGSVRARFGEGALWSVRDGGLWWVDMSRRTVCFTSDDGATNAIEVPGVPGGVAVRANVGVVAAVEHRLFAVDRASDRVAELPYTFDIPLDHVFNDVTVDAVGRLLVGTIQRGGGGDGAGLLLRVSPGARPEVLLDGFWRVNGLAFSPDSRQLFVSDSHPDVRRVWRIEYDAKTGALGRRSLFTDFADVAGRPDGGAMDSEGHYWSAAHDAGCIHRFTPEGQLDHSLALPTPGVTKPAFGGPDMRTLFVTTAGAHGARADDGIMGSLFAAHLPVPGCPVPPTTL